MSTPTSEDGFDSETPPLFNVMKVSSRRSAFFYVDLAKKYFMTEEKLEISGLGQAMETVVTIAEILKSKKIGVIEKIMTSSLDSEDENAAIQKAQITVVLTRHPTYPSPMPVNEAKEDALN